MNQLNAHHDLEGLAGSPVLGIVSGFGPMAGTDLLRKVIANTNVNEDKEHLPVMLLSVPPEGSDFLGGKMKVNPGTRIGKTLLAMEAMNVSIAAVACNTIHAPIIFDEIVRVLKDAGAKIKLLHMIGEVTDFLKRSSIPINKDDAKIGLLATSGTIKSRIYQDHLNSAGYSVLLPDETTQTQVYDAIYNADFGIKGHSYPISAVAINYLSAAARHLVDRGASCIVVGCTELPLFFSEPFFEDVPVIDATNILARALVREAAPGKLKLIAE
ncbi:MAG: amino acid racemase [bacterium]|nr:amino acid racemase [bacterium]